MVNPELSCALSYYDLFRNIQQKQQQQQQQQQQQKQQQENQNTSFAIANDDDNDNGDDDNAEEYAAWVVDEWTPDDKAMAIRILHEAAPKCRIDERSHTTKAVIEDDSKAWNQFYQSHKTNFFKDRHYLSVAFPNEFGKAQSNQENTTQRCLVEVGCGVGNTMLPLLEHKPDRASFDSVYGLDLSPVAIEIVRKDERFIQVNKNTNNEDCCRARAEVCDVSIPNSIPESFRQVASVTTMLFCLSAIEPSKHLIAVKNAISTLRLSSSCNDGGILVFRDYGRFDEAQLKLARQRNKLLPVDSNSDNYSHFYQKHDGTKCYYFTTEDILNLFETQCELETLECRYLERVYQNRSVGTKRRRVWIQARFRRR